MDNTPVLDIKPFVPQFDLKITDRNKKDKHVRGMGIGLSLVKKFVERYNGQIWIEDKVKGDHSKVSNFIFLIPKSI